MNQTYLVRGMHCASCVMNLEESLLDLPGISDAEASLKAGKVTIEQDGTVSEEAIRAAVADAGYELVTA